MVIGIVAEYNPFHNGHLHQINEIRKEFGEDAIIIAVMSGNYTQRGEIAIADKGTRAKCAVLSGVNLVLELPYPFSSSCAEIFASSAVHILNSIHCVDYISFGSEAANIEILEQIAEAMLTDRYIDILKRTESYESNKSLGHPKCMELALEEYGIPTDAFSFSANNILALEYIKALKKQKSNIKLHTIKRIANDYRSDNIVDGNIQSASAIRKKIFDHCSALNFIPSTTRNFLEEAYTMGEYPTNIERISSAIISHFRLSETDQKDLSVDSAGGIYDRITTMSLKSNTVKELIENTETKKFTTARVRRAVVNSFLGVTSSMEHQPLAYTQVLAMDKYGREILKLLRKNEGFNILTKPSDIDKLSEIGQKQALFSRRADSVYELTRPVPKDAAYFVRFTPFVKKDD